MDLVRVGPVREAGHNIELSEQLGDDGFGVGVGGEPIDFGDDFEEDVFNTRDGLLAVVLALFLQAAVMFEKFFAVKLSQRRDWQKTLEPVSSRPHSRNISSVRGL